VLETPAVLFDSLALAAVAGEIRDRAPARFAGVVQPSPDTIVVRLATGHAVHHLLCCIHPRMARLHFAARPEATERLSPFGTLVRSRLVEARLSEVEQPPFNRVLRLGFDALRGRLWLIAELMGRHSNLVLASDRVVLGALKVVTPQMSPRRPVLPGRPYLPPPADRPTPAALDLDTLRRLLQSSLPLTRRLSQALLGISPTLAQEIALRAELDPAGPADAAAGSAAQILRVMQEITATLLEGAFAPTLYTTETRVAAFAPFSMRVFAGLTAHPVPTMSEAIDRYYRKGAATANLEERRRPLAAAVTASLRKRETALAESRQTLTDSDAAERFRLMGELILTHARQVQPRDSVLRVSDYTAEGVEVSIPLDPALTPSANAQVYFRRYAKARATRRAIPARIARLDAEVRALRDALVQIDAAASTDDLTEVHADLAAMDLVGRGPRRPPAARTGPRRYETADGATILVGRSARENDRITFHDAAPDDLWFHARGLAGAHVVLKSGGTPTDASITVAAQLAAYYSEGRLSRQVAVDCVARKHVRKPRGGAPGAVTYAGERTLLVMPAPPPGRPASDRRASV
jgi:predicted ribosome quality control (RQC) complex YloA/Tae2 family protein